MQPYVYPPLQRPEGIRLVQFDSASANSDEPLRCKMLEEALLDNYMGSDEARASIPPVFSALSYVWGEQRDMTPLLCDGKELLITVSLSNALHYVLRHNESNGPLWIDQICINQQDEVERSQQVMKMNMIFSNAQSVFAWLGPERDDTALAVDWIHKIASLTKGFGNSIFRNEYDEEREKVETTEDLTVEQSEELGVSFLAKDSWTAFSAFYDRPWYIRTWIIQEMLPAREAHVVCGTQIVDWHLVKAAASWYIYKAGLIHEDFEREVDGLLLTVQMNLHWTFRWGGEFIRLGSQRRPNYSWDLLELQKAFRARHATVAKDKVYALFGLSDVRRRKNYASILAPDYSKTDREVFRDAARIHLMESGIQTDPLDILYETFLDSEEPAWPTWLPDWRVPTCQCACSHYGPLQKRFFTPPRYTYVEGPDKDQLVVEGIILGSVAYASPDSGPDELGSSGSLRDLWELCQQMVPVYPTGGAVSHAFLTALHGGSSIPAEDSEYLEAFFNITDALYGPPEKQPTEEVLASWINLYKPRGYHLTHMGFQTAYRRRRFFILDSGFMGIGGDRMARGDVVAILWGMGRPVVLSPVSGNLYKFRLDAYCHGAEIALDTWPKQEDGTISTTNIVLC